MRSLAFTLAALPAAMAWTYPYCDEDNCYRALINKNYPSGDFCLSYLASEIPVPPEYANCEGNSQAISSACSCITYALTAEPKTSTYAPVDATPTTSATTDLPKGDSSSVPTAYPPSTLISYTTSASTAASYPLTTKTIYATHVYTITSCPQTVTDCPAKHGKPHVTTEIIAISTTVCPVTDDVDGHYGHGGKPSKPTGKPHGGYDHDGKPHGGYGKDGKPHGGYGKDGKPHGGYNHDGKPHGGYDHDGKPYGGYDHDGKPYGGYGKDGKPHGGCDGAYCPGGAKPTGTGAYKPGPTKGAPVTAGAAGVEVRAAFGLLAVVAAVVAEL